MVAEITPREVHGATIGAFLFVLNNIAGNLPIVVEPLSDLMGLRNAMLIMAPALTGLSRLI